MNYEGDLTLLCDLPEMFPKEKLPVKFHFIQPYFIESETDEIEVKQFLETRPGKKNILISFRSTGDFRKVKFIKDLLFKDFNFIVSGDFPEGLKADNIFCKKFINNGAILNQLDLMICHGGNGTTYQALAFGVPLLAMPVIFEQYWNVEALKRLEVGEELDSHLGNEEKKAAMIFWMNRKRNSNLLHIMESMMQAQEPKGDYLKISSLLNNLINKKSPADLTTGDFNFN
ncbi:MAG: hypothetical protein H0X62_01090 [Bacteroidetes bacterium]|nr:hypothetical protein [Bacteroidota bacterium]